MRTIDTTNRFLVASIDGQVAILNLPTTPISRLEALNLAAYLVAMADGWEEPTFEEVLEAVMSA